MISVQLNLRKIGPKTYILLAMFGTGWTVQDLNPGGSKRLYFLQIVQTTQGLTQPPVQWVSGLSPWSKAAGAWC
jgi:hypothetical protein